MIEIEATEAIPYTWIYGELFLYHQPEKWTVDLPWIVPSDEKRTVKVHLRITSREAVADWEKVALSQTACDYFGPIETCQVRNGVTKRWGALFTCLVT